MKKIIHLVISDLLGAGRAALRISEAVRRRGYDSEVYVLNPGPLKQAKTIVLSEKDKLLRMLCKKRNDFAMRGYPRPGYFHYDRHAVSYQNYPFIKDADLIHLHWVSEGMYSDHFLKDLDRPVVWTNHDMWSFTGGCHYSGSCRKYTGTCGNCPCLGSDRETDLSSHGQQLRIQEYRDAELQFVGCSRWISEQANASRILRESGRTSVAVANPIDRKWFHVRDQKECRKLLGIETDKKLILTGSINLNDSRKGGSYLLQAIEHLDPQEYMLACFGNPSGFDTGKLETITFGSIFDDLHLSLIYGACDVFAAPSVQENLANTVMESLACGLCVTAFDIGGMPDMVQTGFNGFLARPSDPVSFAEGIRQSASSAISRQEISDDCEARFGMDRIGAQYAEIYERLLGA